MAMLELHQGDCREVMRRLISEGVRVQCCATSPPYYGLRDYGTGVWIGGDHACEHRSDTMREGRKEDRTLLAGSPATNAAQLIRYANVACGKCGAVREDRQVGLELTPGEYVAGMVETFRLVRQMLRDDGTLWLNLGDSYAGYHGNKNHDVPTSATNGWTNGTNENKRGDARPQDIGLKPKDLIGIPWRVAFALQADGWYLRSDIIWHKPNPMPESVTDRPTKAHEYLFLLAKSERYYYDAEAVREQNTQGSLLRHSGPPEEPYASKHVMEFDHRGSLNVNGGKSGGRNKRSVWTVATAPYSGAHFATFPPDLIEPCVMAGTSEWGCCPHCGKCWQRIVERDRKPTRPGTKSKVHATVEDYGKSMYPADHPNQRHSGDVCGNRDPQRHCTVTHTKGWERICKCPDAEPAPCTILDPFAGACTAGLVALRLGRRFIGIDLSADYLAMGRKRLDEAGVLANLFYPREEAP